ncbi:hypothetical protein [Bacteroides sp. 224]|uniref:hypothetical protein n=1 Tax=Bacteroides sp. 224 TaxID=2302936 RepID=UPI0013D68C04|nr:hypothetical protein [Bacteroides sp. 224]NDV67044.1 hypothetical protein [Bacteroides sp. 224]
MIQALFYKEWTKTKRITLLVAILLVALLIYTFISTAQMFRVGGAVSTLTNILLKDMPILPPFLKWFPLLTGILIGLVQFIPEMTDKRMKLTLHLPLPETKILSAMLLYGLTTLLTLYVFMYAVLALGLQVYYPAEIIVSTTWQLLPWLLGGIISYLFAAWICFEPIWRYRIFNILGAVGALSWFYLDGKPGIYIYFVPCLMLLVIAAFYFPFYSAARFKDGAQ